MADNVVLNAGAGGDTAAADEIGGVKHQRVKIQYGDDGSATDVSDTNPLPIDDAGGSITVDGTVTADLGATDNAILENIDTNTTGLNNTVGTDGAAGPSSALSVAGTESGGNLQEVRVDADGHLQVDILSGGGVANIVSTDNSTTAPLGISGVFTGTGEDVSTHSAVAITLDSDVDSAASGMTFQFSTDNTNWDDVYSFTYTASEGARRFQFPVTAQYFRVVYTNGGTGQTHLRIQTIIHAVDVDSSIHRLGDDTSPDRSAHLSKSVIIAQASGSGNFVPIQATAGGNFKVALDEYDGVPTGGGVESGALRVTLANDSTGVVSVDDNGSTLSIDGTVTANAGTGTMSVDLGANNDVTATGNVAHDTADSGNPLKIGGKAKSFDGTAPGTDVAEDDRVDAIYTPSGIQYVETAHPNYFSASTDYASAQTNAIVQAAPGASLKLYITDVIISNGATAGNITLLDGSGGTVLLELYPAINGGLTHSFRTPIALTANTGLYLTSTSVTTHTVTVSGYTAA